MNRDMELASRTNRTSSYTCMLSSRAAGDASHLATNQRPSEQDLPVTASYLAPLRNVRSDDRVLRRDTNSKLARNVELYSSLYMIQMRLYHSRSLVHQATVLCEEMKSHAVQLLQHPTTQSTSRSRLCADPRARCSNTNMRKRKHGFLSLLTPCYTLLCTWMHRICFHPTIDTCQSTTYR